MSNVPAGPEAATAEEFQRVLQSLVRVGLSLGGHIGAFGTFIWLGSDTPLWLPALFALEPVTK